MKIIVGLGNPGKKYEHTRHNIGFEAIDYFFSEWGNDTRFFSLGSKRHNLYDATEWEFRAVSGETEKLTLVKPQTFMNLSGEAARFLVQHTPKSFAVSNDFWVLHDDAAVDFGRVKLDRNRSAGGHNGIQNIIDQLGTKDFIRFRVGIREEQNGIADLEDFVLKRFTKEEQVIVPRILSRAREQAMCTLEGGFEVARNLFNGKNAKISA